MVQLTAVSPVELDGARAKMSSLLTAAD